MYKFEALVNFLRRGFNVAYFALPVGAVWYFAEPYYVAWRALDIVMIEWSLMTGQILEGFWQHLGWGLLFGLGVTLLSAALGFFAWVFLTIGAHLTFTRSSVATLAIGFLLASTSLTFTPYFFFDSLVTGSLGVALVVLETKRMAVLAATY